MQVAMIGTGYVGLVSAACFSEFGIHVTCVDKDADKIYKLQQGLLPIYEPGLEALVLNNTESGRLNFTTNIKEAVSDADIVMLAVGTPSRRGDGHADLSFVWTAAEEVANAIKGYTIIVTKSTVPVGTGKRIAEIIKKKRPDTKFDIVSNPEFLREGSAIDDFLRPDRIVVGLDSDRSKEMMSALYRPLFLRETPIIFTSLETAELIKYAANTFLATKITFINEIADLCEVIGANVQDVAKGIGLDGRIGGKFLNAGPGYGGSCFPKDTRAFVRIAENNGTPSKIVNAVVDINEKRKLSMAKRVVEACGGNIDGKTIAVLGVTFKPNTDDVRESPSLEIIPKLVSKGANVRVYDPEGMDEAKELISGVTWCDNAYDAMNGATALTIITEWNEFRALDLNRVKSLLEEPILVDFRNIYIPEEMSEEGFHYYSIGRPSIIPKNTNINKSKD
jgi:UDPglucose 6-dehydrogenase|tara:strand:- start:606 stop:1952 length:1347 start_codon:yes stop_codon:yes gene_type:complete